MGSISHGVLEELKVFPVLDSLEPSLLSQLVTHVETREFAEGEVIVEPSLSRNKFYFLREGIVESLAGDLLISEISQKCEAFGEISHLSGQRAILKIRAKTRVRCFEFALDKILASSTTDKEKIEIFFLKLYTRVITGRIEGLSAKAKSYGTTAHELMEKGRELDLLAAAQVDYLRTEAQYNRKKVLMLEPNKKQQLIAKSAVGGAGVDLVLAATIDEAKELYQNMEPEVIFCEASCADFLFWVQQQNYRGESVYIQSGPIDFNRLIGMPFVQNVISRNSEDRIGSAKSILTSLSKIIHADYFGIEKYLAWGTEIQTFKVTGSRDRDPIKERMLNHLKALGIRGTILDQVQVVAEEVMMNAVYDAPVDSRGNPLYNHLPRTTEVQLLSAQQPDFRFGCDGNLLAVSATDPFGSLPRYVIINYLESCYSNQAGTLNHSKGGAGRGLHQILEGSHWTIFNVKPGVRTEVIGVFDLAQKLEGPPQIHYFFQK